MSRARVVSMIVAVLLSLFLVYAGAVKVLFLAGEPPGVGWTAD